MHSADRPPTDAAGSIDDASALPTGAAAPRLEESLRERTRRLAPDALVTVEITGDDASIAAAVVEFGGQLGRGGGGLYLAHVPAQRLAALAGRAGITQVASPQGVSREGSRTEVIERGPVAGRHVDQDIQLWHNAGHRGAGSKVGIIALFDTAVLDSEITNGELPSVPGSNRTCISAGTICPFGTPGATWGNSLAEIVADGAPDAALYLAELGSRTDYYPVIDWMAANGVTVLLNPMVWAYDGPGNGTGPSAAIVDYAVSKGITWFNTSGELAPVAGYTTKYSGSYWRGAWSDADNDKWLNFSGSDESMSVYCGMFMGLRWSDWNKPMTDYDLYITDFNASTGYNSVTKKPLSTNSQAAPGAQPLEGNTGVRLCNTNPAYGPVYDTNKDGFVSLWVQRTTRTTDTPVGDVIEMASYYGYLEYWNTDGSGNIGFADSANAGMLTVGAQADSTAWDYPGTGRGPTNDGRIKPDLVSFACASTSIDGSDLHCVNHGFYGGDAAAAAVAGYAATARPVLGSPNAVQLARYMRDQGLDPTQYLLSVFPTSYNGWGRATLPAVPPNQFQPSIYSPLAPQRLLDTRAAPFGPIGLPSTHRLSAGETVHVYIPGGSWATAAVLSVALVQASGAGYLAAYPSGWTYPGAVSSVNTDGPGQTRSNTVIVPIGNRGAIDIHVSVATDVIVDVVGLFSRGSEATGGNFIPVAPSRIIDSRSCVGMPGCSGAPIPASTFTDVTVRGYIDSAEPSNVVPADARAVALSVTVDQPAARGFMSAVPGGTSNVSSSSMNYEVGQNATALVIVRIDSGADGVARIFMNRSAHLQVDILGWFTGPLGVDEPAGKFVPLTPDRLIDTRLPLGSPKPIANQIVAVPALGVPSTAAGVFVNTVAIQSSGPEEVQLAGVAQPQPAQFRNLSTGAPAQTMAAATFTDLSASGFTIRGTASAHYVSDVAGYFQGRSLPPLAPGQTVLLPISIPHLQSDYAHKSGISDDGEVMFWIDDSTYGSQVKIWRRSSGSVTTLDFGYWESGKLTTDGSTLVLLVVDNWGVNPLWRVWAVDLDTLELEEVSVTDDEQSPSEHSDFFDASPDGNLVIFGTTAALTNDDTVPNSYDVFVRNRSAGTTTRLLAPAGAATYRLSADGSTLASLRFGATQHYVEFYDMATGAIVTRPIPRSATAIDVSADGSRVLITVLLVIGSYPYQFGLSTLERTSGVITVVPLEQGMEATDYPQLNDEGDRITFRTYARPGIYSVALDGSDLERIDRSPNGYMPAGTATLCISSANGRFVAFVSTAPNIVFPHPTAGQHFYLHDRAAL